jgi:hypothetical protein
MTHARKLLQDTIDVVDKFGGNVLGAADALGISRSTLRDRIASAKRLYSIKPKVTQYKRNPASKVREEPYVPVILQKRHPKYNYKEPIKIFVLPDAQIKPGIDFSYLELIGRYVAEKKPDVIVCIGDFADMESLSSYDVGKKSFEGRCYKSDIASVKAAMNLFLTPIKDEIYRLSPPSPRGEPSWNPKFIMTLGNHEERIMRAVEYDRKLDGTIGIEDLGYDDDWDVYPFLEPVQIAGVTFCHYLTSGVMGRPITTAGALLSKKHGSVVVGHQQGRQVAYGSRADGSQICAIIAGSCYFHNENYLGIQGNKHWRGCIMLHQVVDGVFDEMFVSLQYLVNRYKGKK